MSDYQPNGSFIMPRLEYFTCAQCEQMVYDNAHSLRWYDVDLCSLKCFRMYFERQFRVCATCQTVASTDGDICIYHSAHGLFTFCDANCMDTYRYLNDPCSFCFAQCSKNGRTTARSVGKKKYCSLQCIKANGRIIGTKFNGGQCYTCGKKRSTKYEIKAERANLRNMCSDDCLKLFELNAKVALDTCSVCHIKFDGASSDAAELVEFSGEKRIFCSNICLSYHLKNDTRNNACLECGELVRYYEMIRTLATDEAEKMWCSLDCAKRYASARTPPRLSNTHIELVNRELREVGLDGDQTESAAVNEICSRGHGTESTKVEPMVESRTKYKIPIRTKEQIDFGLAERRESFRLKCVECVRQIKVNEPVVRWQTMNFCSRNCMFDHMLEMHDKGLTCAKCQAPSRIDLLGDVTCRIGNEARFFCGADCKEDFVRDWHMCEFCLNQMDDVTDLDQRFCSMRCADEYEKLYADEKVPIIGECIDCEKITSLPIQLLHDGKVYGFCSFRCFFFLKFSCGIYADQCEMCEKYFERNSNGTYNVRHDDLAYIFCSQTCASHFILKHRVMNICAFCGQEKYNFDMIQEYNGHGKNRMFCSMKCLGYNEAWTLVVNEEEEVDAPHGIVTLNATPFHADKMVCCQPETTERASQSTLIENRNARTQTEAWSSSGIVPIPVPMYMPQPCLIPQPYPSPVPFVLPVVVPIFLAVSNFVGRLTGRTQRDGTDAVSADRFTDVTNRIDAAPLSPTSMTGEPPASSFVQTTEHESSSYEQTFFGQRFETSTPIGSLKREFLCGADKVPAIDGPMHESRRLKPDALLEDFKDEDESIDESIFSQQSACLGNRRTIKRSFSDVDSEDMHIDANAFKRPKDTVSIAPNPEDVEI